MRVKSVRIQAFKRFTDLAITDLPSSARLVVLTGPNGSGKSSVFDAFSIWHMYTAEATVGAPHVPDYHDKAGSTPLSPARLVEIQFHGTPPSDTEERKKLIYVRSAYRNDPDAQSPRIQRPGSPLDAPRIQRLIDNDVRVADNYHRIIADSIGELFSGNLGSLTGDEITDRFVGDLRGAMDRVFGSDLRLLGPGNPFEDGNFIFEKGAATDFGYKNLSGGEKAAFDLILDLVVKRQVFDNTVFCIDEPELHMNSRVQSKLLHELVAQVSQDSQLWIATHSLGMMRSAKELQVKVPEQVVFIDFDGQDFDGPVALQPATVNREYWRKLLDVALDDMAGLIAPVNVVLCEGHPSGKPARNTEFDARCYRRIFATEFPDTDFISSGNAEEVKTDAYLIGETIHAISDATTIEHLIDRDEMNDEEVSKLRSSGIRVLTRRHLESYLVDDEILTALCMAEGQPNSVTDVLLTKQGATKDSVERGNSEDDDKRAMGELVNGLKRILNLTKRGSTTEEFAIKTLVPLVTPSTETYRQLKNDIFG